MLISSNSLSTYITHILKLIFKAYKKTNKFKKKNFFLYIKLANNYYQKCKEIFTRKKSTQKISKIFLKKKKTKGGKKFEKDIKILLNKKNVSIIVNIIKIFPRNKKRN